MWDELSGDQRAKVVDYAQQRDVEMAELYVQGLGFKIGPADDEATPDDPVDGPADGNGSAQSTELAGSTEASDP